MDRTLRFLGRSGRSSMLDRVLNTTVDVAKYSILSSKVNTTNMLKKLEWLLGSLSYQGMFLTAYNFQPKRWLSRVMPLDFCIFPRCYIDFSEQLFQRRPACSFQSLKLNVLILSLWTNALVNFIFYVKGNTSDQQNFTYNRQHNAW